MSASSPIVFSLGIVFGASLTSLLFSDEAPAARFSPEQPGDVIGVPLDQPGRASVGRQDGGSARVDTLLDRLGVVQASARDAFKNILLADDAFQKRLAWSKANVRLPEVYDDLSSQICQTLAFFKESGDAYVLASDINVAAFVEACIELYEHTPKHVRDRLETLHKKDTLRNHLGQKLRPSQYISGADCARQYSHKTDDEMRRDYGDALADMYIKAGVRPLKEKDVSIADIAEIFEAGDIARFNARDLVPPDLFTYAVDEPHYLARLLREHADIAHTIPVNGASDERRAMLSFGGNEVCDQAMRAMTAAFPRLGAMSSATEDAMRALLPVLLERHCTPFISLAEIGAWASNYSDEEYPYPILGDFPIPEAWDTNPAHVKYKQGLGKHDAIFAAEINVRRLPRYARGLRASEKLGISDKVAHEHRYLWFGVTPGYFHPDPCDNVLVQLVSTVDVFVMPSQCHNITDIRGFQGVISRNQEPGKPPVPFFHIRMRPGEGVVIPSGAIHKVVNWHNQRVGLNFFFEPVHGAMRSKSNPASMWTREHDDVLVARSLWVRALARLYDKTGISMSYHTTRMELI